MNLHENLVFPILNDEHFCRSFVWIRYVSVRCDLPLGTMTLLCTLRIVSTIVLHYTFISSYVHNSSPVYLYQFVRGLLVGG